MPMAVTDQQVKLLMKTFTKTGQVSASAAKAGMCRQTGAKYLNGAPLPSSSRPVKRPWRTREDPLAEVWERAAGMLEVTPELEAKALFDKAFQLHFEDARIAVIGQDHIPARRDCRDVFVACAFEHLLQFRHLDPIAADIDAAEQREIASWLFGHYAGIPV